MLSKEDQALLMDKIDVYLEPMLVEYLQQSPAPDALDFMYNWLRKKGRRVCLSFSRHQENYRQDLCREGWVD
jgi:hypothetical protein